MIEKISWPDHVEDEVLHRVEKRNIPHTVDSRKANWIGSCCIAATF
jgi:hypothetical protein